MHRFGLRPKAANWITLVPRTCDRCDTLPLGFTFTWQGKVQFAGRRLQRHETLHPKEALMYGDSQYPHMSESILVGHVGHVRFSIPRAMMAPPQGAYLQRHGRFIFECLGLSACIIYSSHAVLGAQNDWTKKHLQKSWSHQTWTTSVGFKDMIRTCKMPKSPGWRRKAQLLQRCDAALKTWGLAGRLWGPFGRWKKLWSLTDTKLQRSQSEELRSEHGKCLLERRFSLFARTLDLFPLPNCYYNHGRK